jgi:hypothetical protein
MESAAGSEGITSGLQPAAAANTPKYLTKSNRGTGTNAASFSTSSNGSKILIESFTCCELDCAGNWGETEPARRAGADKS